MVLVSPCHPRFHASCKDVMFSRPGALLTSTVINHSKTMIGDSSTMINHSSTMIKATTLGVSKQYYYSKWY